MDDFAILPPAEREPYIRETAAQMNISEIIIEKDFWVCWTLKKLFSIDALRGHLIFKGGTSLSKCYGVIERFSEDIDVSISRSHLGFGGEKDPAEQSSGNKTKSQLEALGNACAEWVSKELKEVLSNDFSMLKGQDWDLTIDPNDPQTLLFAYPSAFSDSLPYIKKAVKIEMGARSDHWPADEKLVQPYISDQFPEAISESKVSIHVLGIQRTFWEKVTLLHAECHRNPEKPLPPRVSRHLYDLWAIAQSPYLDGALQDLDLLNTVAQHKSIYFKSGWAKYDLAKPGTLRICPDEYRLKELEADYRDMREMFFNEPPALSVLIETAADLEHRINLQ